MGSRPARDVVRAARDDGHRTSWTAIIPAAGKGSRLCDPRPKPLYPVLGKPLARWMAELLEPFCERIVFVLAPGAVDPVRQAVREVLPRSRVRVEIQSDPLGMADAVLQAKPAVDSPFALVAWVDQIILRPRTVRECIRRHESRPNALLTFPVARRRDPYIQLVWDGAGRLTAVRQAREGEVSGDEAESDCGLFLFNARVLFEVLERASRERDARGARTGEFNLLPLLPRFDRGAGTLEVWRDAAEEETRGVNTPEQAAEIAGLLARRGLPEGDD
jgi:bifunctional N-acetylglucosamine-1-phosphate-uridyltransferase/glucosamine-1-phosphate-acetyltransferase GlmU-like protein